MIGWRKYGCETARKVNSFGCLLYNGADLFVNCMMEFNHFAVPNVRPFYRFFKIPQSNIENISAADPNPQTFGFNFS